MKLAWYMHHLNTFRLLKTEGVNQRAAKSVFEKPPKNVMSLSKSRLQRHFKAVYKILSN